MSRGRCAARGCDKTGQMRRGYCENHYRRLMNHGTPYYMPPSARDRFMAKVHRNADCWEWTANKYPDGYGQFWNGHKQVPAHRYAWEMFVGPIPENTLVDHMCHNRACVNVSHLRLCTNAENMRNRRGQDVDSVSGIRGIHRDPTCNSWRARVEKSGRVYCKNFPTVEQADAWATEKRRELFGEYAGLSVRSAALAAVGLAPEEER